MHSPTMSDEAAVREGGRMPDQDEWELFTGRATKPEAQPLVTIQTRGNMSINQPAWRALGSPEAVELLWNRAQRLVGMRAADPAVPHAYKLRASDHASTHILSFIAFATPYGIEVNTPRSRRYVGEMKGQTLVVSMNQTPIEIESPLHGKPRRRRGPSSGRSAAPGSQGGRQRDGPATTSAVYVAASSIAALARRSAWVLLARPTCSNVTRPISCARSRALA